MIYLIHPQIIRIQIVLLRDPQIIDRARGYNYHLRITIPHILHMSHPKFVCVKRLLPCLCIWYVLKANMVIYATAESGQS